MSCKVFYKYIFKLINMSMSDKIFIILSQWGEKIRFSGSMIIYFLQNGIIVRLFQRLYLFLVFCWFLLKISFNPNSLTFFKKCKEFYTQNLPILFLKISINLSVKFQGCIGNIRYALKRVISSFDVVVRGYNRISHFFSTYF